MSQQFVISSHVVDTIKALPREEREAVSRALACELFSGGDPDSFLTPFQAMIYSVIRYYVKRDSERGVGSVPDDSFGARPFAAAR